MNIRCAAAALTACCLAMAGVSACSAGITTSSGGSGSPGAHQDAKISLGGQLGDFPIPPGARVTSKIVSGSGDILVLSGVQPEQAASFYTSALPGDGYTVADSITSGQGTIIVFSGHGYRGGVLGSTGAPSWFPSKGSGFDFSGLSTPHLTGNQVAIMLKPR
jgi:hypothetical protein